MEKKNNILKKAGVLVIMLFIGASMISSIGIVGRSTMGGDILYVGGSGPGNYTTIQAAIDDANNGDTVFVYDDSSPYNENVIVDKSIDLIGENRDTTIIYGNEEPNVVSVNADGVTVMGFTVTGSGVGVWPGEWGAGIGLYYVQNCEIYNNVVSGIKWGTYPNYWHSIYLYHSIGNEINNNIVTSDFDWEWYGIYLDLSDENTVAYNTVSDSHWGIYLRCSCNNKVIGNTALNNCLGIFLDSYGIGESSDNTITSNNASNNVYGIYLHWDTPSNDITGNIVSSNSLCGIYLSLSTSYNNIISNTISLNNFGIELWESSNNIIIGNDIISHTDTGIRLRVTSNNNKIYHNNFMNNVKSASDTCNNIWHNGYPFGGNYWDDFDEPGEGAFDKFTGPNQHILKLDGDGIVDLGFPIGGLNPYDILGGSNQDMYPLISQWINQHPDAPTITGRKIGRTGKQYEYTFVAADPDGDDICYFIDWGDGNTEWTAYYASGEEVKVEHVWNEKGTYTIKAKARDIFGAEGPEGTLEVTMPKSKNAGCPQGMQITMLSTGTPETKNIEHIVVGDYITSYDPINQVVIPAEVIEVYECNEGLPDNNLMFNGILEGTPKQTIYVDRIGWMEATDTDLGQFMLENPLGSQLICPTPIASKIDTDPAIIIYDLEIQPLSGEACGYWANGYLVGGYE